MLEKTRNDVIVIGGGAAGLMAALQASWAGAGVLLLEKNEKTGKKIYITGKGRCNVTNTAELDAFLRQVPRNPRFLYSALSAFDHNDMTALLEMLGTKTKVERGGRVFPESDKASDVTRALMRGMEQAGVQVRLHSEVQTVTPEAGAWNVCLADGTVLRAKAVVVATGGVSYPATGSTGDGYRFAEENGLAVTERIPSLVGLTTDEKWPMLLQGLTLKNVILTAQAGKKMVYREMGEMLFTHFGFSGPLFIELSSHLTKGQEIQVSLDLKPGLTPEQLDARLVREIQEYPRREVHSLLETLLPVRMAPVFAGLCDLDPKRMSASLTREERLRIRDRLKALPVHVTGTRPMEEAIVTRGGVDVRGILPGTMMARNQEGLFFAGEVLDVDAHTGGFNLQIAFSTGALAGRSAAGFALR